MKNFNTVTELSDTKSENKTSQYIEMARNFAAKANEIAKGSSALFAKKIEKEVLSAFRKAEQADCEYTTYVNANAAEKWLGQMIIYISQ